VWHDLVTPDSEAARKFYGELFGWTFREHGRYVEILNRGRRIGGIFELKPKKGKKATAEWIASMSVPDVDEAVSYVEARGGKIIHKPVDMPGRGRGALIRDPQGAHLVLLRAEGGDPEDREPEIGDWLWNECWSTAPEETVDFYVHLGGYEETVEGNDYTILVNENKWRAGVRRIEEGKLSGRWIPVVRVEDPAGMLDRVDSLGGVVWVKPGEKASNVRTALISDCTGALLMLQHWTFPENGEGNE